MEKNKYFNKLLEDTAKVVKAVGAQQETFKKALPELEKQIKDSGVDMTAIEQMKRAAAKGDIQALLKAQEQILKK